MTRDRAGARRRYDRRGHAGDRRPGCRRKAYRRRARPSSTVRASPGNRVTCDAVLGNARRSGHDPPRSIAACRRRQHRHARRAAPRSIRSRGCCGRRPDIDDVAGLPASSTTTSTCVPRSVVNETSRRAGVALGDQVARVVGAVPAAPREAVVPAVRVLRRRPATARQSPPTPRRIRGRQPQQTIQELKDLVVAYSSRRRSTRSRARPVRGLRRRRRAAPRRRAVLPRHGRPAGLQTETGTTFTGNWSWAPVPHRRSPCCSAGLTWKARRRSAEPDRSEATASPRTTGRTPGASTGPEEDHARRHRSEAARAAGRGRREPRSAKASRCRPPSLRRASCHRPAYLLGRRWESQAPLVSRSGGSDVRDRGPRPAHDRLQRGVVGGSSLDDRGRWSPSGRRCAASQPASPRRVPHRAVKPGDVGSSRSPRGRGKAERRRPSTLERP